MLHSRNWWACGDRRGAGGLRRMGGRKVEPLIFADFFGKDGVVRGWAGFA